MVRSVNVHVCEKLQEPEREAEVEWGEIDETKLKNGIGQLIMRDYKGVRGIASLVLQNGIQK